MSQTPDPITPDDKDWTWVLEQVCPECGADVRSFAREEIGTMVRGNAAEWTTVLDAPTAELRRRPQPDKWSALEYAAHVRDVYDLYLFRLNLMLTEDGPAYPNWDQDETAVAERYNEQDPVRVRRQLAASGAALADRWDEVGDDDWQRTGYRSDGAEFTVETFARYLIHDPIHHLWDVRSG